MLKFILLFFFIYSCSSNLVDFANFDSQKTVTSQFKFLGVKTFSDTDTLYIVLQDIDSNRYLVEQPPVKDQEILDTLKIEDSVKLTIKMKPHKSKHYDEKPILFFREKKYVYIYYRYISDEISKYYFDNK